MCFSLSLARITALDQASSMSVLVFLSPHFNLPPHQPEKVIFVKCKSNSSVLPCLASCQSKIRPKVLIGAFMIGLQLSLVSWLICSFFLLHCGIRTIEWCYLLQIPKLRLPPPARSPLLAPTPPPHQPSFFSSAEILPFFRSLFTCPSIHQKKKPFLIHLFHFQPLP